IVAVALIGARYLREENGSRASVAAGHPPAKTSIERSPSRVFVHVTGAVRRPGVYRLPAWARLDQALRRAGGPAPKADLEQVNLAAKVADGQQVVVPRRGAAAAGVGQVGGADTASGPLSLNTATPEQ